MDYKLIKNLIFIWLVLSGTLFSTPDSSQVKYNNDPWLAYDKVLHFGISCSLVLSTQYVLENNMNINRETALPVGVTVSAINGIVKEYWDKKIGSFISKRDLIADGAGIIVAIIIIVVGN